MRNFSSIQTQVITGSMLGDAMLEKAQKGNSRFVENHGIKQKEWLDYKSVLLLPIKSSLKPIKNIGRKRISKNKIITDRSRTYEGYKLQTMRHQLFNELELKWYKRDESGNYITRKVTY